MSRGSCWCARCLMIRGQDCDVTVPFATLLISAQRLPNCWNWPYQRKGNPSQPLRENHRRKKAKHTETMCPSNGLSLQLLSVSMPPWPLKWQCNSYCFNFICNWCLTSRATSHQIIYLTLAHGDPDIVVGEKRVHGTVFPSSARRSGGKLHKLHV